MAILRFIFGLVSHHLAVLFNEFDPIKDVSTLDKGLAHKQAKAQRHYIIPFVVVLLTFVMVIIGVEDFQTVINFDIRYDRVLTHKVFPDEMALQSDTMLGIAMSLLTINIANLIISPSLSSEYRMYLSKEQGANSSELYWLHGKFDKVTTRKMCHIRRITRRALQWTMIIWLASAETYFTQQLFIRDTFNFTIQGVFFWFLLCPVFCFYGVFCKLLLFI